MARRSVALVNWLVDWLLGLLRFAQGEICLSNKVREEMALKWSIRKAQVGRGGGENGKIAVTIMALILTEQFR